MSGYCAFATMNKDELRELSSRGGVASGKARRERRRMIEARKNEELVKLLVIQDGMHILKEMYRAMPPEERAELHWYARQQV